MSIIKTTYSSTQCPAVAIQFSLIIAPPHRCVLENPKNDVRRTDTCHGQRPNGAFLPPTIRVSGLPIVDIPQSKQINSSKVKKKEKRKLLKLICKSFDKMYRVHVGFDDMVFSHSKERIFHLCLPAFLAADNVYRFGLSRLSSEISFESGGDNKSVSVASLEITFCCWCSVEVSTCVVLLGRSDDDDDENVVDVVALILIAAADADDNDDDDDEENGL